MRELDTNLYLFQFYHEIDVKRVMEGSPWSFNRRALIMARLKEGENPRCVELNTMELWVQIHDLKVGFMTEKILTGIGNYIGHFIASCPSNFIGVWRDYMRIRVAISLTSPLTRRMKIKMAGNEWYQVNFKYKNVSTFCFSCGIFGHSEKFCGKLFEVPEGDIVKLYGPWMLALFRGQVNPTGAKWLRTEAGNAGFRSETGKQGENSGNDGSKHDPVITPTNLETVGRGENAGVGNIQNLNVKAGKELNIPLISGHPNKKDITVIESKK